MRVTLKDIAARSGCAISTVSAALNGAGRVAPDKTKLIRETADQLGFQPNLAARLLKNHDNNLFGLVITDRLTSLAGHGIYSDLLECFLTECRVEKLRPQFELDHDRLLPSLFSDGMAQGILHAGLISPVLRDYLDSGRGCPCVSVEEPFRYSVRSNLQTGVYQAVQYLAATGHRRPALFIGPEEFDLPRQMEAGFREGCRDFGMTLRPEFMRHHSHRTGQEHFAECAKQLHELFAGTEKPDAIISAGCGFSSVALYELPRMGIPVPEEVSLIGCSSSWEASRIHPGLTAIERQNSLVVTHAMKLLKMLVNGIEPEQPNILVPAELTIRNTVRTRSNTTGK